MSKCEEIIGEEVEDIYSLCVFFPSALDVIKSGFYWQCRVLFYNLFFLRHLVSNFEKNLYLMIIYLPTESG